MRLLNVFTLKLQEFYGDNVPAYAILSHTWEEDEVSYQDLRSEACVYKKGLIKIRACCNQAMNDGYEWVWVDTCCIDKTSSAELSEAINSMFHWYGNAATCYVFLSDLPAQASCDLDSESFSNCKWFTRGWTLQELLAPVAVEFYDQSWNEIGTRISLGDLIHLKTGIRHKILAGRTSLFSATIVERMSWASSRKTSRVEDNAYSLLGIFDINMPLLYGEGKRAFSRLQQEILRKSEDLSILLWRSSSDDVAILAPTPAAFGDFQFHNENGQPPMALDRAWEIIRPLGVRSQPLTLYDQSAGDTATAEHIHPPTITSRGLGARLPCITKQRAEYNMLGTSMLGVVERFYACARCVGWIAAQPHRKYLDGYMCILLRELDWTHEDTSTHARFKQNRIFFQSSSELLEYSSQLYMRLEPPKNTWMNQTHDSNFRVVLEQRSPYALRICQLNSSIMEQLDPRCPAHVVRYRYHMKTRDSGFFHIQLISKPWMTRTDDPEVYEVLVGIRSDYYDRLSCRTSTDHSTLDWVLSRNNIFGTYYHNLAWHRRDEWSDRSYAVLPDRKHVFSAAIKKTSTHHVVVLSVHPWKGAHAEALQDARELETTSPTQDVESSDLNQTKSTEEVEAALE